MKRETGEKRTKKIQVRLTIEEFEQIHHLTSQSNFRSAAELIRYCVFKRPSRIELKSESLSNKSKEKIARYISQQIRPIGINLNQIARHLNSLRKSGREPEVKELKEIFQRIEKKMDMIFEEQEL